LADVSFNTTAKLFVDAAKACADYQDRTLRNLPCKRLQLDEIWSFVYCKAKNVPAEMANETVGDVWTWTALDADTKLVPSWLVGERTVEDGWAFLNDLKKRLRDPHIQLTSDGFPGYSAAVGLSFGRDIDYAQLIKHFGVAPGDERRYSPPVCTGTETKVLKGDPDPARISTSYVERQNLTMRMSMRRFTRLTNGFSKKAQNLECAVALHFMHYNFGRIHKSLRVTPAMEAGLSDHVWGLEEIAALAG
jgi:IS1 family transposase